MKISFVSSKIYPIAMIMPVIVCMFIAIFLFAGKAYCTQTIIHESMDPEIIKWGFISAAVATGLSTIAAAIAVGLVGSSAMGAMSERPEMAGRALIFVGLAEGIAIYGLIIAIMILGKV